MLEIKNLNKNYKSKKALNNVSFTLDNQIYGLLGPNGAGKTTLLRAMTHIIDSEGEISFIDQDQGRKPFKALSIGYLPQKFGLLKELKLKDQMNYFASLKDISKADSGKEIERVLKAVNLDDMLDKRCSELSGGMVRRVGIAQAIMGNPDFILFDEPTAGLDPEERLRFKTILARIQGSCPIILSTHIVEDIESVCHRVLVLNKGEIVFEGALDKLEHIAKDKVYDIKMTEYMKLDSSLYYQLKVYEKNAEQYVRVLSSQETMPEPFQKSEATVEDGYMYLVKGK